MTIPGTADYRLDASTRRRWPAIAATALLLGVGTLSVVNTLGITRLSKQSAAGDQRTPLLALSTRVSELEHQTSTAKHLPRTISQSDLDAAQQPLETRLGHLEQAQATAASAAQLQALEARVAAIEVRAKRPIAALAPRQPAPSPAPKTPSAPFDLAGVELRGGERFLSVITPKSSSVRGLRLLRVGETLDGWQLQTIESQAAVFRVDGQSQRIALP